MIVIQLPEMDGWRIAESDLDFQIQRSVKGKGGEEWRPTNFFQTLDGAVRFAYERILRESDAHVGLADVPAECRKVAAKLERAVKAAMA